MCVVSVVGDSVADMLSRILLAASMALCGLLATCAEALKIEGTVLPMHNAKEVSSSVMLQEGEGP